MEKDLNTLVESLSPYTDAQRKQYIEEVVRWILYRDPNIDTWYSDSQKALLQEIYELRKIISQLKQ